ncbi:hypothetical protein AAY473_005610 [Plecturocebus cupreus]
MESVISASPALAVDERDQGTALSVASEGKSPKPWCLPHGIGPVGTQENIPLRSLTEEDSKFKTLLPIQACMPCPEYLALGRYPIVYEINEQS